MSMVRWEPFREMQSLHRSLSRFLDENFFRDGESLPAAFAWMFPVDISETVDNVSVRAEIPGMRQEDIKVSIHGEQLIIEGERAQEKEEKDARYLRSERSYGAFYRSFNLGVPVKADEAKAVYRNGVLQIILPKEERVKPKQVRVDM